MTPLHWCRNPITPPPVVRATSWDELQPFIYALYRRRDSSEDSTRDFVTCYGLKVGSIPGLTLVWEFSWVWAWSDWLWGPWSIPMSLWEYLNRWEIQWKCFKHGICLSWYLNFESCQTVQFVIYFNGNCSFITDINTVMFTSWYYSTQWKKQKKIRIKRKDTGFFDCVVMGILWEFPHVFFCGYGRVVWGLKSRYPWYICRRLKNAAI